jgi:hypothetical protein
MSFFTRSVKKIFPKKIIRYIINYRNKIKITNSKYDTTVMFSYGADVRNSNLGAYTSI